MISIGQGICFVLQNLPAFLSIAALLAAAAERLLSWLLLLPIGVTGLWAGVTHIIFPEIAAAYIGWQVSPFQFEVGMADLAIGVTACLAFWRDLSFKAAAVVVASIFLLGDAIGHVRQMIATGDFAPATLAFPPIWTSSVPCLRSSFWRWRNAHRAPRAIADDCARAFQ
ncbi:DUF6790 family protein [Candidatus Rhodoblastus alkanivorans]|uniref:DUF6790 family protein n=1 Tax=Candidatus Rhodoblastus alkanivorans TaxID=2954117 RepID=UPI0034E0C0AC